ncbi:MAG: START domain-containing protein [Saprospiraceae bacterium]
MKTLCLLAAGLLLLPHLSAQKEWKLRKKIDDLQVYARTPEEGKVQEIKVKCTVEATLSSIVAIINDVESAPAWVYACTEARLLDQVSHTEAITYGKIEFPFPMQNRDFITRTKLRQDQRTGEVTILMSNLPDYLPKTRKYIRIPKLAVQWQLRPLSANHVEIHYVMASDPGGNIPTWLINKVIDKGPIQSMQAFKKLLQQPKYQNVELSYIKDIPAVNDVIKTK